MTFIIQALNAGAALLLTFLTFSNANRVNKKANQWLGVFFVCVFMLSLDDLLEVQNFYENFPHLFGLVTLFILLLTPSLYMSVVHFVDPNEKWKFSHLKHFSLLFIYMIFSLPFFLSNSSGKLTAYKNDDIVHPDLMTLIILSFFLQVFIYGWWMLKKLRKHQTNTLLFSAKDESIQLGWMSNLVIAFLIMILCWFIYLTFQTDWLYFLLNLILLVGIFLLAYFSIQQQEIFPMQVNEREAVVQLLSTVGEQTNKPSDAILSDAEAESMNQQLFELMKTQKPYLDNELNLPKLAEQLDIPAYKLSYLLNNHIGENFSTFINKYRVEAAKEVLTNPKMSHLTLVQVAYEAGYNSKTVFNTHFKKMTGYSPSTYRKQFKS